MVFLCRFQLFPLRRSDHLLLQAHRSCRRPFCAFCPTSPLHLFLPLHIGICRLRRHTQKRCAQDSIRSLRLGPHLPLFGHFVKVGWTSESIRKSYLTRFPRCSHFMVNNIFEGLIWFWIPVSLVICNDIWAYICGMVLLDVFKVWLLTYFP